MVSFIQPSAVSFASGINRRDFVQQSSQAALAWMLNPVSTMSDKLLKQSDETIAKTEQAIQEFLQHPNVRVTSLEKTTVRQEVLLTYPPGQTPPEPFGDKLKLTILKDGKRIKGVLLQTVALHPLAGKVILRSFETLYDVYPPNTNTGLRLYTGDSLSREQQQTIAN